MRKNMMKEWAAYERGVAGAVRTTGGRIFVISYDRLQETLGSLPAAPVAHFCAVGQS